MTVRHRPKREAAAELDLAARLADASVVICAGAGGVGKTTVAATVGLGLAATGRRVAVVTIDPARRLAEALGLPELGNEPQPVEPALLESSGLELRGELHAMMLDVKRTFDELIELLAPAAETARAILANPVYRQLSTAVAGSQEYTAMAKLFELERSGAFDAIVLDTPPSRNAIDFLEAPDRLLAFLEGRAAAGLLGPTGHAARAAGIVFAAIRRITGVALLDDLTTFFRLVAELLSGFHERAAAVRELLADPATAFLIVTSPERGPVEEAIYFAQRLDRGGLHSRGLILNRFHAGSEDTRDAAVTAARLAPALGTELAAKVGRSAAEFEQLARRDRLAMRRLADALDEPAPFRLSDREADVHDISALVELHRELFGDRREPSPERPEAGGREPVDAKARSHGHP